MKKIKEYIKNIDFELVDDDVVLENVYEEIKGSEAKLMIDIETSYNIQQLIKKSNVQQIIRMLKNVNIFTVINKKIGSRVFETLFDTLFDLTYKKKIDIENVEEIRKYLLDPIYKNFEDILSNRNGTYVIRKYFCYVFGRRGDDKKKYKKYFEGYDIKSRILDLIDGDLNKEGIITVVSYLKTDYSKTISRKIIEIFLTLENIKNPHYSFIFEDIIEIGDRKTVELISKFIEGDFDELVNDKCANYVVSKLIGKIPEKSDVYFSLMDLSTLNINSNIVLRVFENFCRDGKIENVKNLLTNFYQISEDESVFYKLLISSSEGLNTKFIDSVIYLVDLEGDVLNVNSDLVKYYNNGWLNKKCGIKLIKSFLEGGAPNKTKKQLISKLNISASLLKKKDGLKISNLCKTLKRTKG